MSGGDYKTDAKVFPQAITGSQASSSIGGERFAYNKCAPSGALFMAVSDPATGANVSVALLDSAQPAATSIQSARALITGGINLVADPLGNFGFGEFSCVERGALDTDGLSAIRVAELSCSALSAWSPTNAGYDRLRSLVFGDNIGDVDLDVGILATAAQLYLADSTGAQATGIISADTTAASINASSGNWLPTIAVGYAFNGSSFNRIGIGSAAMLAEQSSARAQLVSAPGDWSAAEVQLENAQASVTQAAGGAGVRHVCTSISATLVSLTAAAEATVMLVLLDGAAILWAQMMQVVPGRQTQIQLSGLHIVGSVNTAMTLQFAAAGGANTFESVAMTGHSAGS